MFGLLLSTDSPLITFQFKGLYRRGHFPTISIWGFFLKEAGLKETTQILKLKIFNIFLLNDSLCLKDHAQGG